jgi:hypothetical protein
MQPSIEVCLAHPSHSVYYSHDDFVPAKSALKILLHPPASEEDDVVKKQQVVLVLTFLMHNHVLKAVGSFASWR